MTTKAGARAGVKRGPYRKSYIVRHGRGFKFVRAIPKELQPLEGKKAYVVWLGVIDRSDAETRAHDLAAEFGRRMKRLEALPQADRKALVSDGGIPGVSLLAAAVRDLEHTNSTHARGVARSIARIEHGQKLVKRVDGAPTGALMSLVDLWEKVRCPRSYKSGEKTRLYMRRFIEVVGDLMPLGVQREHVIKFRDALEAKGLTPSNVAQHLDKLNTVFNTALSEGKMTTNPAYKIKARKGQTKLSGGKQGFDAAQVKRIFTALDGETVDFGWIIKLLAYHGARGSEVCQLRCADVTTLHAVPVLRIHDQHGRVKNRQSVRDVPIHPKCKAIIAYAAKIAAEHGADSWLFPSLTDSKQGRGHNWQNYVSRKFLRLKVGITDRAFTMHSLRHTFSTSCREAGMPDAVKYALMGHALGKGEGGKYGEAPSLKQRAKWIAKVDPLKG